MTEEQPSPDTETAPQKPAEAPQEPAEAPQEPAEAPQKPAEVPQEPAEVREAPRPVMVAPRPPEPEPAPPTPFAWAPPQGFEPLPQDFLIYSPTKCQGRSILSLPLDVIDLPRDKSTIKALVCLLLEPTLVVDAMGHLVEARAGQEILVECGHFLRRLIRSALDPKSVGEVWMRPVGKMGAEGGDSITLWDIRYGKAYPRDKVKRPGR